MSKFAAAGMILMAAGAASAVDVYTDLAAFEAATGMTPGSYYLEDYSWAGWGTVNEPTWLSPEVNGFQFMNYGVDTGGGGDLYTVPGAMSTNSALDGLGTDFTMSPTPIYAFGGYFYGSDFDGGWLAGDVNMVMSDGTVFNYNFTSAGPTDFRGFVSTTPFAYMEFDTPNVPGNAWPAIERMWVTIPAPGSLALLGLSGLALRRRR